MKQILNSELSFGEDKGKSKNKSINIIIVLVVFILFIVVSYLYKRNYHGFGSKYVSSPIEWLQINYDEEYSVNIILYYLHIPIAKLDEMLTNTEIHMWKNNFHGKKENYSKEAFN